MAARSTENAESQISQTTQTVERQNEVSFQ